MCSSISSFSLFFPSKTHTSLRRRFNFSFSGNPLHIRPRNPSHFPISASVAEKNSGLEFSWGSSDKASDDDYNGWDIVESAPEPVQKKGTRTFSAIGIGASVAAVLGLVAYFSLSSKGFGFRLRSPFNAKHGSSVPQSTITSDIKNDEVSDDEITENVHMADETSDDVSDAFVSTETSFNNTKAEKLERIIIPFAVDSAQREALLALKTLEIIEGDVKGDELCTRREYARWLVLSNLLLERRRNHRVNTSAALSGSRITAFNDVGVEDPDFEYIQSLAEAGIVRSKLSDGSNSNEAVDFFPERFICRQDLVNWKAKLEYEVVPGINEEISRKNIGFLDVKEISSDVLVDLFVDIRADEKSIIRGVFGQSKRLQPSKPCTKGQAAVALTSGRTTEFIKDELSRIGAENSLRQIEFREVVSELLESGEIKRFWETKIEEERNRGLEVEANYCSAISALEQEKNFQENALAEFVKQKAALDCQEQLLSSLKAEVANLSERICIERNECIDEQCGMKDIKRDLEANFERLVDAKSILEAEVEALRILRSWIEDEARKSHARAKVLLEAGRRWKWES